MTIQSGLFRSNGGDRRYKAAFFASYFASFIGNGVFPNPSSGLLVAPQSNLNTVVRPGKGWINGYYMVNDADFVLSHDIADSVLSRIDRVVMGLSFLEREINIYIKKGLPASTPTAPALQRDADIYELALADVFISNGALVINQSNITDQRLNSALCGIVAGTVNQVDTTNIFNQYQLALQNVETQGQQSFDDFLADRQEQFDVFFQSIQDTLDGDIAANLASRISQLENDKANQSDLTALQATVTNLNNNFVSHRDNYLIHGITGTTSGGSNVYALSPNPALTSYARGLRLTLFFNVGNTGPVTINISGLGTVQLRKNDGNNFSSGELVVNTPYTFVYNGTAFFADSGGGGEALIEYENFSNSSNIGKITSSFSTTSRYNHKGGANENYALFAGGSTTSGALVTTVGAITRNLVVATSPTNLSSGRLNHVSLSFDNKIYFAGGNTGTSVSSTCDVYDENLVRSTLNLNQPKQEMAAAHTQSYALFAGGYDSTYFSVVEGFDASGTKVTAENLRVARSRAAGASLNGKALFIGGDAGSASQVLDVYDDTLTRIYTGNVSSISTNSATPSAETARNHVVVTNGLNTRAIDDAMVITNLDSFATAAIDRIASTSALDRAYFSGGGRGAVSNMVNIYSASLERTTPFTLNTSVNRNAAQYVGDYILDTGGVATTSGTSASNHLTVSAITYEANITVFPGDKYRFTEAQEQTATTYSVLTYPSAATGYVKVVNKKLSGYQPS